MNVREYAQAQQRPLGPLHKLIRAVLHALGVPVTDDHVNEVAIRLYRPLLHARDLNYAAALTYLRDLDPDLVVPAPRDYPLEAVRVTVDRVVRDLRVEGEPVTAANRADLRVIEMARPAIDGQLGRQALEPAREVTAAIGEDEQTAGYGWARVLVGAYSCSFCAMLASRGPVYTSRQAALGRGGSPLDLFHVPYVNHNGKTVGGFCDCTAVMVPRNKPWEGQAAYHKLDKLWQDTTEGHSGDDARNAFRRTWDKKVADGTSHEYLADSLQPNKVAAEAKTPTPPKPAHEPLPGLTRKPEGHIDHPETELAAINPRWKESRQWQINCTRCATSIELRARGYDVTATPKPKSVTDNDYVSILDRWNSPDGTRAGRVGYLGSHGTIDRNPGSWMQKQTGVTPGKGGEPPLGMGFVYGTGGGPDSGASRVWDYLPAGPKTAKEAADAAVQSWGPGSRGYITVKWARGNAAHIFNVENRDGEVIYRDGQSNELNASDHWDKIKGAAQSNRIVRTDDLTPRPEAADWVTPRDEKYYKLETAREKRRAAKEAQRPPNFQEMHAAAEESGYTTKNARLYTAFRTGLTHGYTSSTMSIPDKYADPAATRAYQEGFAWVKRWKEARKS